MDSAVVVIVSEPFFGYWIPEFGTFAQGEKRFMATLKRSVTGYFEHFAGFQVGVV
jgi:hypothetical protein